MHPPVIPEAEALAKAIRDLLLLAGARKHEQVPARDDRPLRAAIIEAGMTGIDSEQVEPYAG